MLAALRTAHRIAFSSYFLRRGPLERALIAARPRGAEVHVRLDGRLYGGSRDNAAESRRALSELRRAHIDARFVHVTADDKPGLHMKAAVCDGVAFLDDCNWAGYGDTVVRDDTASHVRAIREAALSRRGEGTGSLALTKLGALSAEARTISGAKAGSEVDVETETLGASAVSNALRQLAASGVHCRLLVSDRAVRYATTHDAAISLQRDGVDVRTVKASEKLALAGRRAWIGSANASWPYLNRHDVEWSLTTTDESMRRRLKERFDAHWRDATPIAI
jgi:phosphatidylserine/phosphatidylglycerophosphate/cardiolipin synthase-like enzyme